MITYIIATYLGPRRSKIYNKCQELDRFYFIRKHIERLSELEIPDIQKIVLVINQYDDNIDKKINQVIEDYSLKIPIDIIFRDNFNFSYGAWEEAIIKNLDISEYFFLIEDDYIPSMDNFYKTFIEEMDEGTAFVANLMNYQTIPIHSSISNGLLSAKAAKDVFEKNKHIFSLDREKIKNVTYHQGEHIQLTFLETFIRGGYKLKDVSMSAHIPFLESREHFSIEDKIIFYGDPTKEIVIEPTQMPKNMFNFRMMKSEDVSFVNSIRNGYAEDFLHDSRTFTDEECLSWFNETNPKFYIINYFGYDIGYFRTSDHDIKNKKICIGCDIHPEFTGHGHGYLAYKAFLDFLFKRNDLNKIYLEVLANNSRAIHLYEKLGFVLEGIKREDVLKNNQYIDSKIMSILKKEFE